MRQVCVFCGSRPGNDPAHAAAARELGAALAVRNLTLVTGGGRVGLMGEVASAALSAGGSVTGIMPQALSAKEIALEDATELVVVGTMHQRKQLMADRADAFVALPGGFGTMDELFEILTWAQLGIHTKPVVLLNVAGFYDPLLGWADHMTREGFLRPEHRAMLLSADTVDGLFAALDGYAPGVLSEKWARPGER